MTGPEHYREAERLLAESRTELRPNDEGHCEADRTIAEAQVHATLALAAAQAPASDAVQLETDPTVAYVYRAAWSMTPLGTYTNAEAARMHCEADAINHNPEYDTGHVFDWLSDESEPDAPHELVIGKDGVEEPTEYMVTRVEVATEYDPEADA